MKYDYYTSAVDLLGKQADELDQDISVINKNLEELEAQHRRLESNRAELQDSRDSILKAIMLIQSDRDNATQKFKD